MEIRTYQRGDEEAQAVIYNSAVGSLPKFKLASVQDIAKRVSARDFDPATRFYAVEAGKPVAYAMFNPNGRVSYPWCGAGHEDLAIPLFQHMLEAMAQRGHRKAFAAYRGDWPSVLGFFREQGFTVAREMVNFVIDIVSLPTVPARPGGAITPLQRGDVPAIFALAQRVVRSASAADLEQHLFSNPYFPSDSVFVMRGRSPDDIRGVGVLIRNRSYADPKVVDSSMPCFRLGAFGTEGMQTKRINGLFSFLCREDGQCGAVGADLMGHAASLLQDGDDIAAFAGQVPSDAPNLLRFYEMMWRRQGSFPVLEREL